MPQMTRTVRSGAPGVPIQASVKADPTLHQALPPTHGVYIHSLSTTGMLHKVRLPLVERQSSSSGLLRRGQQLNSRSEGNSKQVPELTLSFWTESRGQKSKLATSWEHLDLPFHSSLHLGPPSLDMRGEMRA